MTIFLCGCGNFGSLNIFTSNGGGGGSAGDYTAPPVTTDLTLHLAPSTLLDSYADTDDVVFWGNGDGLGSAGASSPAGSQPEFFASGGPNNGAFIRFDGVDDYMTVPNSDIVLDTGLTAVLVVKTISSFVDGSGILSKGYSGDYWNVTIGTSGGLNRYFFGESAGGGSGSGNVDDSPYSMNADQWYIRTITIDATGAVETYSDGDSVGSAGFFFSNMVQNSEPLIIAATQDTSGTPENFSHMDLAEAILYNRVLNTSEREEVECELSARHNIALSYTCP